MLAKAQSRLAKVHWMKWMMLVFVLIIAVAPAFAQSSIDLTEEDINQIWSGMNIMIGAIGGFLFLIAGFKLGPQLLMAILRILDNVFKGLS